LSLKQLNDWQSVASSIDIFTLIAIDNCEVPLAFMVK